MATNMQNTRPTNRAGDTTVAETTPVVTPAGTVGGVAVFDHDADRTTDSTLRPTGTMHSDPVPVGSRSSGSMLSWIIGAIVLIVLAYFLLQILF